mmetsp:Transcript_20885/g.52143  ORF Transcript_20885/g.52143 Transcript_20885/m.52143 type:complete len:83 (+) Transcript_20885:609-857(+)
MLIGNAFSSHILVQIGDTTRKSGATAHSLASYTIWFVSYALSDGCSMQGLQRDKSKEVTLPILILILRKGLLDALHQVEVDE